MDAERPVVPPVGLVALADPEALRGVGGAVAVVGPLGTHEVVVAGLADIARFRSWKF